MFSFFRALLLAYTDNHMRFPRFNFGIAIALGLSQLCMSTVPVFADGFISSNISSCAELQAISNMAGHYVLTGDIDCTGVNFVPLTNDDDDFFSGTFNGQGYAIRNLSINADTHDSIGLFVYTSGATIQNLRIIGATVTGGSNRSGILAGQAGLTTISNVGIEDFHMTSNSNSIGGLVGYSSFSTISTTYVSSGAVIAGLSNWVGGMVGIVDGGSITDIYSSSVTVTGEDEVGGLIGKFYTGNANASVTNAYADADVTSNGKVGGLIGWMVGGHTCTVTSVFSVGTVSYIGESGRLVGKKDALCTISNAVVNYAGEDPVDCIGNDSDTETTECTTINNNLVYFYEETNAPLIDWNFDDTWSEETSRLPLLAWIPPDAPTNASARVSGKNVTVTWTNPINGDFQAVTVMRSRTGYPANFAEGDLAAAEETDGTFTQFNLPDGTYYYSIFALDHDGNVSDAAHALAMVGGSSGTPQWLLQLRLNNNLTPEGFAQSSSSSSVSSSTTSTSSHPAAGTQSSSTTSSISSTHSQTASSESTFEQRTCTRVLKWFTGNDKMLLRVNERLLKRFGFSC